MSRRGDDRQTPFRYRVYEASDAEGDRAPAYDVNEIREFLTQLRSELLDAYVYVARAHDPAGLRDYQSKHFEFRADGVETPGRATSLLCQVCDLSALPKGSTEERKHVLDRFMRRQAVALRDYLEALEALEPLLEEAFLNASAPGRVALIVE